MLVKLHTLSFIFFSFHYNISFLSRVYSSGSLILIVDFKLSGYKAKLQANMGKVKI